MELSPVTIVRILTDVTGLLPGARSLHDLLAAHPEEAAALIPVMQDLGEAPAAISAAEKAAPNLTKAIKGLVGATPDHGVVTSPIGDKKAENLVRALGGIGTMTPQQEAAWVDRFTPTGSG